MYPVRIILALAAVGVVSCQMHADQPTSADSNLTHEVSESGQVSETAVYRCENSQVVEVDWMASDGHPRLRTAKHRQSIDLRIAGNDYVGGGFALNGVETIRTISIVWPGRKKVP